MRNSGNAGAGNRPGDAGSFAAGRAARRPPRWWVVVVPCLLTLPVMCWGLLDSLLIGGYSCFDVCNPAAGYFASPAGAAAVAIAELAAGATAFASLIVGLAKLEVRRAMALVGWMAFLLAGAGVALLILSSPR